MQFVLRPEVFIMLTQIGELFTSKVVNEEYYIKKMNKRIEDSHYYGRVSQLSNQSIIDQYLPGTAVLEKIGNLAFFDDRDASYVSNFDIDGCYDKANCEIIGLTLQLKNRHK
jgi:hypothetical protein